MKFEKIDENRIRIINKVTGKSISISGVRWTKQDLSGISFIIDLATRGDKVRAEQILSEFKEFQKQVTNRYTL